MIQRPPRSTRTDTLFPYTTLFRSLFSCSFVSVMPSPSVRSNPLLRRVPARYPTFRRSLGWRRVAVAARKRRRNTCPAGAMRARSEEHTSELQSIMRHSYAVFCLKKKKVKDHLQKETIIHYVV